jgi:pantothenate kinase-related protein Tda10
MSQLSAVANWRAEQKLKLAAKNRKAKAARQARRAEALSRAVPHDKFHGQPITAAAAASVDIIPLQHGSEDTEGVLVGCLPWVACGRCC